MTLIRDTVLTLIIGCAVALVVVLVWGVLF